MAHGKNYLDSFAAMDFKHLLPRMIPIRYYFINFAQIKINYRMKKVWTWLKSSNRLKHIGGGFVIGFLADGNYCAAYTGIGVAAALELKDKLWGGQWDWVDFGLTIAGTALGRLTMIAVCGGKV